MLAQRDRDLEQRTAERDRALHLLAKLERIATASGLCSPVDQAAVREARALLVDAGIVQRVGEELRAPVSPSWADDPPPFASSVLTRKP